MKIIEVHETKRQNLILPDYEYAASNEDSCENSFYNSLFNCFLEDADQIFNRVNFDELLNRYFSFDLDKLPLIDIAKKLNLKIEKSMFKEILGEYDHAQRKIVLGSDYIPTYVHELAHAIDFILPGFEYEEHSSEIIAELSTVILCKYYKIPINITSSTKYIIYHVMNGIDINIEKINIVVEIINRVKKITEFIFMLNNE